APLCRLRLFDLVLLMVSLVSHTQRSTAKSSLTSGPNSGVHFREQLCLEPWRVDDAPAAPLDEMAFAAIEALAQEHYRDLYLEMRQRHLRQLQVEKDKADYSFRARRKLLQAIGLPEVRDYRLRQLAQEESQCAEELRRQGQVLPQLTPLLMLKIS
ncbi:MAG: hypothetical protein KA191_14245, partial [Verrucomicrobia bacterium]|nr:hypothetical protein [Verrucomicrobiota bacterium]MDI9381443.1 hypothetical protein [Verrucomicrobiota bacterium]